MAEAGSFADRVKQQADIVRVIGEYVQLKKAGQNFRGLCPFHSEKSPSFNVHPVRQIYHCFGCGVGGDVFKFVMEMEKCPFPEAIRVVAEKCGIAVPTPRERSPEERRENQQRTLLIEMHRVAQAFFAKNLENTSEGKVARAYLEDRGLTKAVIEQFGIGYAPSGGDILLCQLKTKYPDKLLVESGLISRDQNSNRLFDRFRRRITFPIANESGKIVAFGCRALGDDMPKYLNSPETPIYSKSNLLYHLDRAKDALRRSDFAILVEGYMDAIAVARAGISNVVASCGTSLAEPQIKLLSRFTRRVIVNYDPDTAGQTATERSISLLLEHDFEVRVLALPGKADPDKFIREQGKDAYLKVLKESPPYVDYLIARARRMDLTTGEGKRNAVNFLLPYIQKIPNRLLRSEWATRIAQQLRLDEPVLRAELTKAAAERRGEMKVKPELIGRPAKPAERRLVRMLAEAEGFRLELAHRIDKGQLHVGLETEKILAALMAVALAGEPVQATEIGAKLEDRDRRVLFEILFEDSGELTWEEAESCIVALQQRRAERELTEVQRSIEASPAGPELRSLLERKQELMKRLAATR
ncbi:MAG TPA: DNA primase [Candidatus Sulfotelmatobacter sp.]|nr:DNA primase [Candidatus Sulfotelmatobacter sp.]